MAVKIYVGNCLERLQEFAAESVHCIVTSPPYFGLRDYGTAEWEGGDAACDHMKYQPVPRSERPGGKPKGKRSAADFGSPTHDAQDNALAKYKDTCGKCGATRIDNQLGLEETPEEYIANLVAIFREVRRVLRADGVVWLNLGDSYAGSGAISQEQTDADIRHARVGNAQNKVQRRIGSVGGLKPKDLMMIPARVSLALQADGWWLRSQCIWHKPNAMPESVTDRPTNDYEVVYLLAKAERYFYDADAIREPASESTLERWNGIPTRKNPSKQGLLVGSVNGESNMGINPAGRNKRAVWSIPTRPYSDAHFATFPPDLVEPMIKAGTSEKGVCGHREKKLRIKCGLTPEQQTRVNRWLAGRT